MKSILFEIGPITIYSYGAVLALALILAIVVAGWRCQRIGLPKQTVFDLGMWVIVGGLIGARLFYVAFNLKDFVKRPLEILMIHHGGLVFYGGFLGGLAAASIFLKVRRLPFLKMADLVIPVLPLAHGIGRMGCFLNGCCYGRPTTLPWGVNYPLGSLPERHFGRDHLIHPTQLYEMGALIGLFLILLLWDRRKHHDGQTLASYLLLYPIARFVLEFFRGDNPFLIPGVLTIFQGVSLVLFLLGLGLMFYVRRNH